jgi:hypothetical protein
VKYAFAHSIPRRENVIFTYVDNKKTLQNSEKHLWSNAKTTKKALINMELNTIFLNVRFQEINKTKFNRDLYVSIQLSSYKLNDEMSRT